MRRAWAGVGAAIVVLAVPGCQSIDEMPGDQPCKDAAFGMASRTYECSGDAELANARYERFASEYKCIDVDPSSPDTGNYFHCSVAIGELTCEQVEQLGEDLDKWFAVSNACAYVIMHADGTRLGPAASADGGVP